MTHDSPGKIGYFRQKMSYNSKKVKDRCTVSIKVEQELICALSNGDIFVVSKHRDFMFG